MHSLNDAFNVKCHKSCSLLGKSKLVEKAANVQLRMIKYVNYVIICGFVPNGQKREQVAPSPHISLSSNYSN